MEHNEPESEASSEAPDAVAEIDLADFYNHRFDSFVTVTASKHFFLVHKAVLEETCPFFAAALADRWTKGDDKPIDLGDEYPLLVALFIDSAYRGTLPAISSQTPPNINGPMPDKSECETLAYLYIFANSIGAEILRENIHRELNIAWDIMCGSSGFYIDVYAKAFASLPQGDKLLNIMTESFKAKADKENVTEELLQRVRGLFLEIARSSVEVQRVTKSPKPRRAART